MHVSAAQTSAHHYDEIGLFKPAYTDDRGYRYYSESQFDVFFTINCLSKLGMPLKEIGAFLNHRNPQALKKLLLEQREEVLKEEERIRKTRQVIETKLALVSLQEKLESNQAGSSTEHIFQEYTPEEYLLNPGKPIAVGPYSVSNYAMEAKKNQEIAMENSKEVIREVARKYRELTGRGFELFEEYKTEDADYIMLIMGSAAGTAKQAVDELREEGKKVGVLKLRVFRPFPAEEIAQALKHCKVAAIMDRCESYNGHGGPLASEVPAALFREKVMIEAVSYIYGLAGRDFTVSDVKDIFAELEGVATEGKEVEQHRYIRLR